MIARILRQHRPLLITLLDSLGEWRERIGERRHLMTLDDRALADIGISRVDAEAEYRKMPWRR